MFSFQITDVYLIVNSADFILITALFTSLNLFLPILLWKLLHCLFDIRKTTSTVRIDKVVNGNRTRWRYRVYSTMFIRSGINTNKTNLSTSPGERNTTLLFLVRYHSSRVRSPENNGILQWDGVNSFTI